MWRMAAVMTALIPAVTAQGGSDASTRASVGHVLQRVTQLTAYRCRADYEWLVDIRDLPRGANPKPAEPLPVDWAEHVYADGEHVWCKVTRDHARAAELWTKVEHLDAELARLRMRPSDQGASAALEAKLVPLRTELRDLCNDRVHLQDGRSWFFRQGGEWIERRAPETGFLPDPGFLAKRLLELLPESKWSQRVGESEQRPATVFELRLDTAPSRALIDSEAVSDVGLRGFRTADYSLVGTGNWSRMQSGQRIEFDGWINIRLEVDPPSKLPLRIAIDMRPNWLLGGDKTVDEDQAICRIVMRMRQAGYARTTEDDRER